MTFIAAGSMSNPHAFSMENLQRSLNTTFRNATPSTTMVASTICLKKMITLFEHYLDANATSHRDLRSSFNKIQSMVTLQQPLNFSSLPKLHPQTLNHYLRLACDNEHPTLNKKKDLNPRDFLLNGDQVQASTENGLSFFNSFEQLAKVLQIKSCL